MEGCVLAVVGGQYGSEGKGAIVGAIAHEYDTHVRTGGPNAGHTFYDHQGRKWVQQVVPCGWINPDATLILGRGMVIDVEILRKELLAIAQVDPTIYGRLKIDVGAMVLDCGHHQEEGGVNGELHQRIGSTGEGVGAARVARMKRDPLGITPIGRYADLDDYSWLCPMLYENTPKLILERCQDGLSTLLEGTQGSGLSLIHGPWPYVTSADTNAAQLCADAGISPLLVDQIMLVIRTYPIRVAGNSGPLFAELSWADLSKRIGKPVCETTTVTKKVRRVGEFDLEQVANAVVLNQPTSLALTFLDYVSPEDAGVTEWRKLSSQSLNYIRNLERSLHVPIQLIQTGPASTIVRSKNY